MRPPETVEEQFRDDLVDSEIINLLRIILLNSYTGAVAVPEVSCTLITLKLFDNYELINWTYYYIGSANLSLVAPTFPFPLPWSSFAWFLDP